MKPTPWTSAVPAKRGTPATIRIAKMADWHHSVQISGASSILASATSTFCQGLHSIYQRRIIQGDLYGTRIERVVDLMCGPLSNIAMLAPTSSTRSRAAQENSALGVLALQELASVRRPWLRAKRSQM